MPHHMLRLKNTVSDTCLLYTSHTYVKINQRVKVKILDIDEDGTHFKLSLKAVEAKKARSMRKRKIIHELPKMEIGFTSLAEKLDSWIEDANR